jgi:hypothetical protein
MRPAADVLPLMIISAGFDYLAAEEVVERVVGGAAAPTSLVASPKRQLISEQSYVFQSSPLHAMNLQVSA